jgi:hypothetical protein
MQECGTGCDWYSVHQYECLSVCRLTRLFMRASSDANAEADDERDPHLPPAAMVVPRGFRGDAETIAGGDQMVIECAGSHCSSCRSQTTSSSSTTNNWKRGGVLVISDLNQLDWSQGSRCWG